jgi:hypothetical protein
LRVSNVSHTMRGRAGQVGVDPKLETLKIGTNCSERRFEWQQPEFSGWNFGLQWRDEY